MCAGVRRFVDINEELQTGTHHFHQPAEIGTCDQGSARKTPGERRFTFLWSRPGGCCSRCFAWGPWGFRTWSRILHQEGQSATCTAKPGPRSMRLPTRPTGAASRGRNGTRQRHMWFLKQGTSRRQSDSRTAGDLRNAWLSLQIVVFWQLALLTAWSNSGMSRCAVCDSLFPLIPAVCVASRSRPTQRSWRLEVSMQRSTSGIFPRAHYGRR